MLNGKVMIVHLIVGSMNKKIAKIKEYFPETKSSEGKVKVKLDLSNYATKANLKNATGVDTWNISKKLDLANLKSNIEKLHIHL